LVGSEAYGTFSWTLRIYRNTVTGKARDMGLGSAELFTLKQVRERALKFRQLAADGLDPIEEKRRKRDEARDEARKAITFKEAAQRFLDLHTPTWKNEKHRDQWSSTLEAYAYRTLGPRPVSAIDGALITETLSPIWITKQETARRVKQRIERVLQWVKDGMPLPQQGASRRVKHHAALPFVEVPTFMIDLRKRDSITAKALEVTILTALRTSEVIGATWSEIDLDAGVWTLPASRMKGHKEHAVPLSKRTMEILKSLPRIKGCDFVFPGARDGKPLSNMSMLELLRGMKNGYTVHGFRSAFRDWAGDHTNYARDVIEHALAHQIKDKAEAAYRRSDALEKRRKLMEAWSRYCASPLVETGDKVVPMKRA